MYDGVSILSQHYQSLVPIGDGGQAHIYKGCNLETGRNEAIKFVGGYYSRPGEAGASRIEQVQSEIQHVKNEYLFLKVNPHPSLIPVYRLSELKVPHECHFAWFSMALCETTVSKQLNEAVLARRVLWCSQLLDGAAYIHVKRITHRDIKPANLLMPDRNSDQIRIGDFGVASDYGSFQLALRRNPEQQRTGTRYYMAPEVWEGPPHLWDERLFMAIDQYATGVTIHEILTRNLPGNLGDQRLPGSVQNVHILGIAERNYRLQIPERPGATFPRTEAVLRRMLARRVEDRFPSLSRCRIDLLCAMTTDGLMTA